MNNGQPIHSIEYELTTELAAEVQRTLPRLELRHGWRRELRVFVGALVFATLIIWLSLAGWILPGVGGALLCVVMLFVLGAILRRWFGARGATMTALLALHTNDRRVRVEFGKEGVRLETEFLRGEGAWTELDDVVVFDRYWLLRLSNGGRILVPGSLVSPELEAFLCATAQQVGAPVRRG